MMNDDDDEPKSFFNFAETWYADTLCRVNIFVFPSCRRTKFLWVNEGRLALPRWREESRDFPYFIVMDE